MSGVYLHNALCCHCVVLKIQCCIYLDYILGGWGQNNTMATEIYGSVVGTDESLYVTGDITNTFNKRVAQIAHFTKVKDGLP